MQSIHEGSALVTYEEDPYDSLGGGHLDLNDVDGPWTDDQRIIEQRAYEDRVARGTTTVALSLNHDALTESSLIEWGDRALTQAEATRELSSYRQGKRRSEFMSSEKEKYLARLAADGRNHTQVSANMSERVLAPTTSSQQSSFRTRHKTQAESSLQLFSYREKARKSADLLSEREKYLARRTADVGSHTAICQKLDDRLLVATASRQHSYEERHVTDAEAQVQLMAYGRPHIQQSLVEHREAFEEQLVAQDDLTLLKPRTVPDELPGTLAVPTMASSTRWDDRHLTDRELQIQMQEGGYGRKGTRAALAEESEAFERRRAENDNGNGGMLATVPDDLGSVSALTKSSTSSTWAARRHLSGTGAVVIPEEDTEETDEVSMVGALTIYDHDGGLHEGGLTQREFESDFNRRMRRRSSEANAAAAREYARRPRDENGVVLATDASGDESVERLVTPTVSHHHSQWIGGRRQSWRKKLPHTAASESSVASQRRGSATDTNKSMATDEDDIDEEQDVEEEEDVHECDEDKDGEYKYDEYKYDEDDDEDKDDENDDEKAAATTTAITYHDDRTDGDDLNDPDLHALTLGNVDEGGGSPSKALMRRGRSRRSSRAGVVADGPGNSNSRQLGFARDRDLDFQPQYVPQKELEENFWWDGGVRRQMHQDLEDARHEWTGRMFDPVTGASIWANHTTRVDTLVFETDERMSLRPAKAATDYEPSISAKDLKDFHEGSREALSAEMAQANHEWRRRQSKQSKQRRSRSLESVLKTRDPGGALSPASSTASGSSGECRSLGSSLDGRGPLSPLEMRSRSRRRSSLDRAEDEKKNADKGDDDDNNDGDDDNCYTAFDVATKPASSLATQSTSLPRAIGDDLHTSPQRRGSSTTPNGSSRFRAQDRSSSTSARSPSNGSSSSSHINQLSQSRRSKLHSPRTPNNLSRTSVTGTKAPSPVVGGESHVPRGRRKYATRPSSLSPSPSTSSSVSSSTSSLSGGKVRKRPKRHSTSGRLQHSQSTLRPSSGMMARTTPRKTPHGKSTLSPRKPKTQQHHHRPSPSLRKKREAS